jgi:hypothetical protein
MKYEDFLSRVRGDGVLHTYIDSIVSKVTPMRSKTKADTYLVGADVLFAVAAYVLYKFAMPFIEGKREEEAVKAIREYTKLTAELVALGFPPDKAAETIRALADDLSKRHGNDPVLDAIRKAVTQ